MLWQRLTMMLCGAAASDIASESHDLATDRRIAFSEWSLRRKSDDVVVAQTS